VPCSPSLAARPAAADESPGKTPDSKLIGPSMPDMGHSITTRTFRASPVEECRLSTKYQRLLSYDAAAATCAGAEVARPSDSTSTEDSISLYPSTAALEMRDSRSWRTTARTGGEAITTGG